MKGDFFIMKSICIKTNQIKIITYLLDNLNNISIEDISINHKQFSLYHNIIIHYFGDNIPLFVNSICEILTDTIIKFYERKKIQEMIYANYFYFSDEEQNWILNHTLSFLDQEENLETLKRKEYIYTSLLKYLTENKSVVLEGVVNFRLGNYMKILDSIIDICVNEYIIEKEYIEFIHLLQSYIHSQVPTIDVVHLIYMNQDSILVDKNRNIIDTDTSLSQAKYLSDISFSSNDFTLNTLLKIIPNRIFIHIIDSEDEFIQTIKSIFEDRVILCHDCSICHTYRLLQHSVKR